MLEFKEPDEKSFKDKAERFSIKQIYLFDTSKCKIIFIDDSSKNRCVAILNAVKFQESIEGGKGIDYEIEVDKTLNCGITITRDVTSALNILSELY